jgi:hypothetical protein
VSRLRLEQVPLGEGAPESTAVAAWLSAFEAEPEAPLAYLPEPLWRRSALGGDSALGNWVTDVVLAVAGADVVVLNSSGLRADLEQGLLLRSDLELALPFDEPWLVALLSGAQLRRGLERAARRSSARGCESALQVAGLAFEVSCSACSGSGAECLRVTRGTPFGASPVADDEQLLVALPAYLTLESADFEAAGRALARPLTEPVSELIAGQLARISAPPSSAAFAACERELRELSPNRCREGFGAPACPLSRARAAELCRSLPQPRGGRDDRIVLVP